MKKQILITVNIPSKVKYHPEEIIDEALEAEGYTLLSAVAIRPTAKKVFTCDMCGEEVKGFAYPVYNENFARQRGLRQCESCFSESIK
jgi:hypothetical protein